MTEPEPGTAIPLEGAANCRDLGGWKVSGGGAVRRGLVYRSTELAGLTDRGLEQLAALGLTTIYDLRTAGERAAQPDRIPEGVVDLSLDVFADDPTNAAAGVGKMEELFADPKAVEAFLSGDAGKDLLRGAYRDVVGLPSAIDSYRTMFGHIADAANHPVLFHCTTGKDRTGWGSASLLTFLGVSEADVLTEYMLTNTEILPLTQPMYDAFAAAGGNPDVLRPVLGVEEDYLHAALEEVDAKFGSIDAYFSQGLGLGDDQLDALRTMLIDTDA